MTGVNKLNIRDVPGGAVIPVKVVPGSSRDGIVGVLGDCLKVVTSAPPEKGKANAAVAEVLARALGVQRRRVALVAGAARARKEFRIAGAGAQDIRDALSMT